MEKKNLALGKINFIMLAVSMLVVVIGFILMAGDSSDVNHYDAEIFNAMHTKVAPVVTFLGFIGIIPSILYRGKSSESVKSEE